MGKHYYKSYCYKATDHGIYDREIDVCEIIENNQFTANFFPKQSYILRVKGKGFMRNQIRLMMGALLQIGKHELTLQDIKESLTENHNVPINYIAPASGLILNKVEFL